MSVSVCWMDVVGFCGRAAARWDNKSKRNERRDEKKRPADRTAWWSNMQPLNKKRGLDGTVQQQATMANVRRRRRRRSWSCQTRGARSFSHAGRYTTQSEKQVASIFFLFSFSSSSSVVVVGGGCRLFYDRLLLPYGRTNNNRLGLGVRFRLVLIRWMDKKIEDGAQYCRSLQSVQLFQTRHTRHRARPYNNKQSKETTTKKIEERDRSLVLCVYVCALPIPHVKANPSVSDPRQPFLAFLLPK